MKRREILQALSCSAMGLGWASQAQAQAFPAKPLRYIVPVSAGGGSDMIGRTVTERWGRVLNQTFIVDNQGGGGGVIACQSTIKSPADGYTLMQGYVATHGTSPATRSVPYDAIKDFTPIGMIGGTPNALVVNPDVPVRTVPEFVAYLRAHAGQVSYGSSGAGSLTHLCMELLSQKVGVPMTHVPYRGIAPAFTDLIGGQTQVMFPGLAAALPHIESGRVRILAITGNARSARVKDVPTLDELGFKGFDSVQWYGVVGPAGIPAPVVRQLNDTLNQTLRAPDLRDKLSVEAVEPMPMSPEQFAAYIRNDIQRWSSLAQQRNIHLDS